MVIVLLLPFAKVICSGTLMTIPSLLLPCLSNTGWPPLTETVAKRRRANLPPILSGEPPAVKEASG